MEKYIIHLENKKVFFLFDLYREIKKYGKINSLKSTLSEILICVNTKSSNLIHLLKLKHILSIDHIKEIKKEKFKIIQTYKPESQIQNLNLNPSSVILSYKGCHISFFKGDLNELWINSNIS